MVMDTKNGDILAMVGSKDYFSTDTDGAGNEYGAYNVVTQGERQPGSSIKPVTYATALKKGYTAATMLMDTKTVFHSEGADKDYIPVNYDGKFHGPTQMRFALGNSFNIPAVKMIAEVGIKDMLTTANDMGMYTLAPTDANMRRFGYSVTLGGGEVHPYDLVSAYTAFANGGYRTEPVAILKVTDSKGKVLFEKKQTQKKQVIDPGIAFIISHMLLDNNARAVTFGTNSLLNIPGKTVAVKTGTTDDKRDNWTIGWTPSYIVGVWVGNNDNSPMNPALASGVTGAAPIWSRIFKEVLKDKKNEEFKVPDNVTAVEIDALGGGKPVDGQAKRTEYFIKGTEPQSPSPIYQKIDGKDYIVFKESDPVSTDGVNRWQQGIDEWVNTTYKDDQKYHPPGSSTSTPSTPSDLTVKFDKPNDRDRVNDNDVDVSASASGPSQIVLLRLFIDDKERKAWESSSFSEKININSGSHIYFIHPLTYKNPSNYANL
jgi:membrane carboxypeptidase/penicillin-binding protein